MKIKSVKFYKPPAYPTIGEAGRDARLLDRLPRRWRKKNSLATLLGTGLMIHFTGSARDGDAAVEKDAVVETAVPREREATAAEQPARAIPVTRVAPLLEEALANDGRGGFGCVAVTAPVFLSENEALDVIYTELTKAGLKLNDMVSIDGFHVPAKSAYSWDENRGFQEAEKLSVKILAEGSYTFDFGTEDKSVAVKFLREPDYNTWRDEPPGFGSSVWGYDFSWLATQVRNAFRQRAQGGPVIIGLFFEPSTYPLREEDFDLRGLDRQQQEFARTQINALRTNQYDDTKARGREKLRAQVSHFVEYLKQEGVAE